MRDWISRFDADEKSGTWGTDAVLEEVLLAALLNLLADGIWLQSPSLASTALKYDCRGLRRCEVSEPRLSSTFVAGDEACDSSGRDTLACASPLSVDNGLSASDLAGDAGLSGDTVLSPFSIPAVGGDAELSASS